MQRLCESIMNLDHQDQWFTRCNFTYFSNSVLGMVAFLFSRVKPFVQFGRGHFLEHFFYII